MRYSQIRKMDISNGEGVGMALFVQGCHFHCKNCFNQDTWDFSGGKEWTDEVEEEFLKLVKRPHIKRVTFLGGEPMHELNREKVLDLIKQVKELGKIVWLYTGYVFEKLPEDIQEKIKENVDVLVDGPFIYEERDLNLEWRGSRNQKVRRFNSESKTE